MLRSLTLLSLALLTAAPAVAAPRETPRRDVREPRPPVIYAPAFPAPYGRPGVPVCVPWCPQDTNPCDPPQYKQADGRCMQNDG